LANLPTTIFQRLSWSAADCTIYEGDETGGKVLFKIAHNDLRDRAVFDANGVEIPTGYRRKMLAMLPVYALVDCGC
jgi:hypothetical protein